MGSAGNKWVVLALNKYVDNFETLNYRPILDRRKREVGVDTAPVSLKFRTKNKTFHLKLHPVDSLSNEVFADEHSLDVDGVPHGEAIRPHEFLYAGEVVGDPHSRVHGSILDGLFDGHIHTGDGRTYTVEKAARYFDVDERPRNYHSLIYADDEINHGKFRAKREVAGDREGRWAKSRQKRELKFQTTKEINGHRLYSVRTCSIYLQADQKLYMQIFHKEGNRDHVRTREEIVSLFYNHIKAVNHIYETTDFRGILGLNFVIQRTTIYTNDSLAYALTFRDFVGGTLGLAWVASPNYNTAGGICQVFQRYNEGSRGMVYRSLNTGIVTLVNYGNRVPARVSQLTLAHEIGHNLALRFHDYPADCQPGLPDGNFIMFSSATSGDKPNNARFSTCSVANISSVLYEVLQQAPVNPQFSSIMSSKKRNCFQERTSAFCGNQIREPGEECDCGFSDRDCQQMADRCCQPHEVGGRYLGSGACKRYPGAFCSPSEGQCCNAQTCAPVPASDNRTCREESECLHQQQCDGRRAECPDSVHKPNGIPCQDATKVCHEGSCNGSGSPSELCHLACEKNGKCLSTFDLPEFSAGVFHQQGRKGEQGLLLHPGSPCNNYKGECFRCRSVDANGPLARLKNLLFNKETILTVSQWSREHWWACVLIGVGVLLLMAVFVKCCAVHTPSTNPNKLPAQHFADTLRHPGTLLRRRHHTPQGAQQTRANGPPQRPAAAQAARPSTSAPANRPNRQRRHRDASANAQPTVAQSRPVAQPPRHSTPPPPYSATDPALPPTSAAASPPAVIPATQNVNVAPVSVPMAPAPPLPPTSSIPVAIPGPPAGQGPRMGRRKKPTTPQKQAGGKDEKKGRRSK
ncbi:hypothetical protein M3Y99_01444900 [Aphelenchoides fujianensis]|nr:hypothetical protein M3Y99_01444900 [Aphelenchoides fujianensis]